MCDLQHISTIFEILASLRLLCMLLLWSYSQQKMVFAPNIVGGINFLIFCFLYKAATDIFQFLCPPVPTTIISASYNFCRAAKFSNYSRPLLIKKIKKKRTCNLRFWSLYEQVVPIYHGKIQ